MNWEVLEAKIEKWIHNMRISVKLLFAPEKKICDHILDGVESLRDQAFAELTANSFAMLLSLGDATVKSKRSPEKLFPLIDMFETMRKLEPEVNLRTLILVRIFRSKPCTEMKEATQNLRKLLAKTGQETFTDFEAAVKKDETKSIVVDGSVHPLTSYVVNYIKYLFGVSTRGNSYQATLSLIFQEFHNVDPHHTDPKSVLMRIIEGLHNNLDDKSKQSEARDLLGDDWVQIHRRIVQQYAKQYKKVSWEKILQCLVVRSSASGPIENSNITRESVKERFKSFNSQFEELHQRQCQWIVPHRELRGSLRDSVTKVIVPAFELFLKRFGPMMESGKNPQKYIRFTSKDLERMHNEFFEGKKRLKKK
ncbi:unnamed protein product, partial [Thlaspi arvense]